jgi:hypothetical protein
VKQITNRRWVVYQMAFYGKRVTQPAVCTQAEWAELETATPGRHHLVRAGFANEGEAEQYARNSQPEFAPRPTARSTGYVRLSDYMSG